MNPLRHMAVDAKMAKIYKLEPPEEKEKLPVVGLNPIQELLNILRVCIIIIVITVLLLLCFIKYNLIFR